MPDVREDGSSASALTYSFRRSLATRTEEFSLTGSALVCSAGSVPFSDFEVVRIYSMPGLRMAYVKVTGAVSRCIIRCRSGQTIELVSQSFVSLGKSEDRSAAFNEFVSALVTQVSQSNPSAAIVSGMPPLLWWVWFVTFGGLAVGLVSIILLAAIGLIAENDLTLAAVGFLLVLAVMLIGPVSFVRALWRRRTRPIDPKES